uniref:Serum response factor-binding protein 1 n=1 Tax=Romanomermis culicivorax TaxID=13658 RepID=A0A915KIY3_ROMCU
MQIAINRVPNTTMTKQFHARLNNLFSKSINRKGAMRPPQIVNGKMTFVGEENKITACLLNRTIVELRRTIDQCRIRCTRKLLHQVGKFRNKKGNEQQTEKNKRKVDKLLAEVQEIKKIKADDVSKFALINTKTLPELMTNASAEKAALYKLALCNPLMNKVDNFRENYPKWPIEVPFILQRLGLQYKTKKNVSKQIGGDEKSKMIKQEKITKKQAEMNQIEGPLAGDDSISESASNQKRDKKRGNSNSGKKSSEADNRISGSTSNHEAANKKDGNSKAVKTPKEVEVEIKSGSSAFQKRLKEKLAVVPLKEGKIGQMEVRRLKLDEIFGDEILPEENESATFAFDKSKPTHDGHLKNDPFFANSDDEESSRDNIPYDNDESIDFLLEDDDENITRKKVKPNNLKTKFATSLRMGNDARKVEEKVSFKKREIQLERPQRGTRNANRIPLGNKNPTQNSGENRKTRRMKMRQEVRMPSATIAPPRPQRKSDQKSAGLLVEVVRTLTTSPSQAQKELQRERLEKDYAITSHNIDRLITGYGL